jgi:hypothetical protein
MKINEIILESFHDLDEIDLENTVIEIVTDLIDDGHTEVDPSVITNKVVELTSQPFLLKDLVKINNDSDQVRDYIDSITPTKVKFSTNMLTVKNDDSKEKDSIIQQMASRATSRNRL